MGKVESREHAQWLQVEVCRKIGGRSLILYSATTYKDKPANIKKGARQGRVLNIHY